MINPRGTLRWIAFPVKIFYALIWKENERGEKKGNAYDKGLYINCMLKLYMPIIATHIIILYTCPCVLYTYCIEDIHSLYQVTWVQGNRVTYL